MWSVRGFSRWGVASITLFVMIFATACVQRDVPPEQQVSVRAEARWKAMMAGDYRGAYQFLSPGFRIKVDEYAYRNRFAGKTDFHAARVTGVTCESAKCQVEVETQYTVHAIPPFSVDLDTKGEMHEEWVLLDDEWWLVPRR